MEQFTPEQALNAYRSFSLKVLRKNLNNPSFIQSAILTRNPGLVMNLLEQFSTGDPDHMVERFTFFFQTIQEFGIVYPLEDFVYDVALHYLLKVYSDISIEKDPNIYKSIQLIVKYGIGVNGSLSTEEEPIPIFIAAEKYRMYNLMDFILQQPVFILHPEYLTVINEDLVDIDRIREEILVRLHGGTRSNKRSRYDLD